MKMRLIDADAMKKDIEAQTQILKLMFKDDEDGFRLADIMYEGYMAQIDKMPTIEPEQQWIPCSEGLPKTTKSYLVTNSKLGAWCVDRDMWIDGRWVKDDDVIAWMPLPEPWKGEE